MRHLHSDPPPGDAVGADSKPLRPRGSNQIGMSQFNERVVLQAIRIHGSLPKADLARLTNLSTQTVSLIINRLLEEGLVQKRESLRGRVGQPSVPIALDPDGAFAIGIKIGRRSLDILLVDFLGQARERFSLSYAFPDPDLVFDEIGQQLTQMRKRLGPEKAQRLCGIGIAAPLSLGGWGDLLGVAPEQSQQWDRIDIYRRVQAMTDLPVEFAKDTAAACVAELVAGRGRSIPSFLYVFVDTFIGGGLVIDSHLRSGLHRNAGALGSMAMRVAGGNSASPPEQLLSTASLYRLEHAFTAAGLDAAASSDERALRAPWVPYTRAWLDEAARAIALAVNNATCVLDLDGVIIDGSFNRALREEMLAAVRTALDCYNWEGAALPEVFAGTIGSDARAIGGALLPLYANFAPDHDLFLKLDKT
jgi:predicted NBD/HSP70 family sugar kinase